MSLEDVIRGALCRPGCKAHEGAVRRIAEAIRKHIAEGEDR